MLQGQTSELKLAGVFSDNMVLQHGVAIPVWGTGTPGETVTIRVGESKKSELVMPDGSWSVSFDPLDACQALSISVESPRSRIEVRNILTGEVWICSGQSNMEFLLQDEEGADFFVANANHPSIRKLCLPRSTALNPQTEIQASWEICTPETAGSFSAVAYHFATRLHHALDTPVGLITNAYGGSCAEAWTPADCLASDPDFSPILETWEEFLRNYHSDPRQRELVAEENRAKVVAAGLQPPPWPLEQKSPESFHRPSVLFNAMVHPLIPFPAKGFLWYQGEANFTRAHQYPKLLSALLGGWRQKWQNPDLWFLIVQLPKFSADWIGIDTFTEIRESQMLAAKSNSRTAITCNIDLGDPADVHPRRKQEVGERLAKIALGRIYQKNLGFLAPEFRSRCAQNGKIRLDFDNAQGLHAIDGTPRGFTIAGPDKHFMSAQAEIHGQSILIEADPETTRSIRYAWANAPEANVCNEHNLPLFPFRTDDWPIEIHPNCVRYFDKIY